MNRSRLTRAALGAAALVATSTVLAAPAGASSLVKTYADCAPSAVTEPFAPWGDDDVYKLIDGGTFEDGATGWRLFGGAHIADGNEPAQVNGPDDASSLRLPAGSAALSAPVCIGHDEPTMRFFAARTAGRNSLLSVFAQFELASGATVALPVGVDTGGDWSPTAVLPVIASLLPPAGEYTKVRFLFAPLLGGDWRIDDVYVDPRMSR